MPNAINPNDYNVEFFNTVFQGTTTVEDFREYLFSRNLPNLPPELVNSPAGNFEPFYNEKGLEKDINYTPITNPGDLDEWFLNGGLSEDVDDVRYDIMNPQEKEGKKGSKYGPASFLSYNCPNLEPSFETGFIQYPTSSGGGDFKDLLKTTLLDGQLNLGPGAVVDFKSDLADLGKERRKQEVINRLKLKGENMLGKVNLDPIGLLAGQDFLLRDYNITVRPGLVGNLLEKATDFVGFEIPTSPIPYGAFGIDAPTPTLDKEPKPYSYKALLDSTGGATKSLIYQAVARNSYGPLLEDPNEKSGGFFKNKLEIKSLSSGQAPQMETYLNKKAKPSSLTKDSNKDKPIQNKINQAIGKVIDGIARQTGVGTTDDRDKPSIVWEVDDSGIYKGAIKETGSLITLNELGFAGLENSRFGSTFFLDTWQERGPVSFFQQITRSPDGTIGTDMPVDMYGSDFLKDGTDIPKGDGLGDQGSADMFWAARPGYNTSQMGRGILKFTQDLINSSNGKPDSKARFIGNVNSADNFKTFGGGTKPKHKLFSMGNTVFKKKNATDGLNSTDGGRLMFANEDVEGYYCRSWSARNPYKQVKDLIRHGNSDGAGGRTSLTRPDFNLSVLDDNGFVKVAPYVSDRSNKGQGDGISLEVGDPTVKKYMLSIENLAWQNSEELLKTPACEHGPNGGRIMWFPPYDINFTDNSSVNWESTNFIGRGEPIYTYNNTERTGTLSFKIVVDHSMALTNIKNEGDDALFQYFAGCSDPVEAARYIIPYTETEQIIIEQSTEEVLIPLQEIPNPPSPPENAIFYFRHAYKFENDKVGTNLTTELTGPAPEEPPNYPKGTASNPSPTWPDGYLRGGLPTISPVIFDTVLNTPIPNPAFTGEVANNFVSDVNNSKNNFAIKNLDTIIDFLLTPEGKRLKIKLIGTTSESGAAKRNKALGKARWTSTQEYLYKKLTEKEATMKPIPASNLGAPEGVDFDSETKMFENADLRQKRWEGVSTGEKNAKKLIEYDKNENPRIDEKNEERGGPYSAFSTEAKLDRSCIISLTYNPELDEKYLASRVREYRTEVIKEREVIDSKKIMKDENQILLERLAARAKEYMAWECSYFEKMEQNDEFTYKTLKDKLKYFHPAFHSMTPEGFNSRLTFLKQCTRQGPNIAKGEPSNMAFGKPPICVLRVGDFYHTKIVIDTVNFTFDPLQWDLNPEGIGVQPMLCSVDLNFKFIGGSSLGGPISQLQNAVSHNFFANTGLYLPRTIYKSVGDYKQSRKDPITGQIDEIKSNSRYKKDEAFSYGAYISPNQVIGLDGKNVNEESALTPPPDPSEKLKEQQQQQSNINPTPAPIDDDTQKQIDEAFDEKVEDRAGAFKIFLKYVNHEKTNAMKFTASSPSVDLYVGGPSVFDSQQMEKYSTLMKTSVINTKYADKIFFIASNQESLTKIEIKTPSTIVGTKIMKSNTNYTSNAKNGLQTKTTDPIRQRVVIFDSGEISSSPISEFLLGVGANVIPSGTYEVTGYANVKGSITEDATDEVKEIKSSLLKFTIK